MPPQLHTLAAGDAGVMLSMIEMENGNFTSRQINKFEDDPELYLKFVKTVEKEVNSGFQVVSLFGLVCLFLEVTNSADLSQGACSLFDS